MDKQQKDFQIQKITSTYLMPPEGLDIPAVLKLCRPTMKRLCKENEPEDWLTYTYNYMRAVFYPSYTDEVDFMEERREAVLFYLEVLHGLFEREYAELPFERTRNFALLTKDEWQYTDIPKEYTRMVTLFENEYFYAFMRLSRVVTPFNTLGHIAGVHHVAMFMARQLIHTDTQIDLGLASGAALVHDIGKFGCRPSEAKRVPYLHYYYTYDFSERYKIPHIGSIASNHSVWDLELENLSVESLLLIYADFRVKSIFTKEKGEEIRFWTLDEAYDIILGKLDNVDDAKKRRYARVYAKLKDFENYLISLGCATDLDDEFRKPAPKIDPALMTKPQIVQEYKYKSIASNLLVMANVGHRYRFIDLLESIRSEKNWRHVRAYLTVIDEYSKYLNQKQRDIVLDFLYDTLSHTEGDIRRQAGAVAGNILAGYDISFTKELPEGINAPVIGVKMTTVWKNFLDKLLSPDHMIPESHRRWKGYAMKTMLNTLIGRCSDSQKEEVLRIYLAYYDDTAHDPVTTFILLDGAMAVPRQLCTQPQRDKLFQFALKVMPYTAGELRATALYFVDYWLRQGCVFNEEENALLLDKLSAANDDDPPCIRYLVHKIRTFLNLTDEPGEIFKPTELYLENQRSETPWYYKQINLEILKEQQGSSDNEYALYQYASHLLSIHQFTDRIVNRLQAGEDLVSVIPKLNATQQTEIVLELIRSIEMGEYVVSKYIPSFLGRMYICLPEKDRDSLIDRFHDMMDSTNPRVVTVTLETLGVIMEHLPKLRRIGRRENGLRQEELVKIEGMLVSGLVHYETEVVQEAFYTIGHGIFGSKVLDLEEKRGYFLQLARGILAYMHWEGAGLYAYYNAAALHHIYRFISDYLMDHDLLPSEKPDRIAFFPGTFDPFSLGHKAIVKEISDQGFRVYLASDEFSWSKKTQPYRIRRKIMEMSVVELKNVFLFPEEYPINIASPRDLRHLKDLFPDQEVYIVAGSDVVSNASAYRKPPQENSIHTFPHIIFDRISDEVTDPAELRRYIEGEVIYLRLPVYYENMSSSLIRSNVSDNKDIGNLVETRVQNYIYSHNLYSMEPMFKKAARSREVDTILVTTMTDLTGNAPPLNTTGFISTAENSSVLTGIDTLNLTLKKELLEECGAWEEGRDRAVVLTDSAGETLLGAVVYHVIGVADLMSECGDISLAARLRDLVSGRLVIITSILGTAGKAEDNRQIILNDMLAYCQEVTGYTHAICFRSEPYKELLRLQGFLPMPDSPSISLLDIRRPIAMIFDTPSFIKEPFCDDPAVQKVIWQCHRRILEEVTRLYPGHLVLCFDSAIVNHRLIKLITDSNPFPEVSYTKKPLGEKMCVPFGKVLRGVLVPNCVTKDLNTEKVYNVDMKGFDILQYPEYSPLQVQIRTIHSFERPAIFVDDVYHKGYRMDAISDYLKKEEVTLDKLVVGVLSGRGRDLATLRQMTVEAPYFVPNMRCWMIESDLYPFLGGDGIHTPDLETEQMQFLPSINTILPYQVPGFMYKASIEAVYRVSEVSLENARDIFRILEKQYQKCYGRKLTLMRISEVVAEPRIPDGALMDTSMLQDSPSSLLEREMMKLKRHRHLLDGGFTYEKK